VRIAVEMVKEGLIDETTAVKRVNPDSLNHLLLPQLDPEGQGQAGGPGASPPAPAPRRAR
jgi:pyruvate,orthophosphate dikinase